MSYNKVAKLLNDLYDQDSVIHTLYITDYTTLSRINSRYGISPDTTYDNRHEYIDTSTVSELISRVTKIKVTSCERHFRTWRKGKRAKLKQATTKPIPE